MKPKGYYLHYRDIYDPNRKQTGIDLKVAGQIKSLNNLGCDCSFVHCPQPETTFSMVKSCLPGFSDGIRWPEPSSLVGADFLYIRCPRFVSKELLSFLRKFKGENPAAKVIYEIPTYPYDEGMNNIKMYAALRKDRRYRNFLCEYVDRISDLSGTDKIFNVDTVQIFNGIDLDRIKKRQPKHPKDEIHLSCVAFYCDWHGIDRILYGLKEYYDAGGDRCIVVHLAGAGDGMPLLKRLTDRLGLRDHVKFPGVLSGRELDDLYDRTSMSIASLGLHRIDLDVASTLKTREYLAKGIPFIYSGEIDVFLKEPLDLCLQLPHDDSPVDFDKVVSFHDDMYRDGAEQCVTDSIRAYAERSIAMDVAMEKVAEYLRS